MFSIYSGRRRSFNSSLQQLRFTTSMIAMSTQSDIGFVLYRYDPSLPAAIVFIVLFALAFSIHLVQLLRSRTWYFIPFVIGGLCESTNHFFLVKVTESQRRRSHRICRSGHFRKPDAKLDQESFHHAVLVDPHSADPLLSFCLHDPRPPDTPRGGRAP